MNVRAVLGAAGAAIVGALVWGLIGWLTYMEVAYVAIGVGALIGLTANKLGGNDQATAISCSVLAIAAIFGGKCLAIDWAVQSEFGKIVPDELMRVGYDETAASAKAWAERDPDKDVRVFMVDEGYAFVETAEQVTDEDVEFFQQETVPFLEDFHAKNPTFEDWSREQLDEVQDALGELSTPDMVRANLDLIDVLFALCGIVAAYRLALGAGNQPKPEEMF